MAEYKPSKVGTHCECGAAYARAGKDSGYLCASSVRAAAIKAEQARQRRAIRKVESK